LVGGAIVLAYVLVSMGVIITFLLAAFVIGRFIGRQRQRRRREQRGEE
jgi:flagellar biogenesis protein FliO